MAYLRKLSSLEDLATVQLAINLCQDNSFKEVAMCLEKPISDFVYWRSSDYFKRVEEWEAAIDEQCQRLTDGLPNSLKHGVYVWIMRIALEYSSYSKRMELLFKIPRNFFMNILTVQDWTETGRVNEMKLAKRLLKNEKLAVWQRYRIACVYCLHKSIPYLWNRLTSEEKQLISGNDDPNCSQEKNHLVLLWSYFMDGRREEKVTKRENHLWPYASLLAVHYGNQAALMQCWKMLDKNAREHILMKRALQSLEKWKRIRNKDKWIVKLASNAYRSPRRRLEPIERFNLPSYYSELLRFFLSKMSKRRQLKFFEIAFVNWESYFDSSNPELDILDCLLEWPLENYFLPTIHRLWEIIPKELYERCLLSLAIKYCGYYDNSVFYSPSASFYTKENLYYDYRSMLWNLWEETPEEYKEYVFSHKEKNVSGGYRKSVIEYALPMLLTRSPLQENDIALFKRIWHDVPAEKRKIFMYDKGRRNICLTLVEKEMWSFIDWMLKECLPDVEIPTFKLKFAKFIGLTIFIKLLENCEKYVEDFIDWAFDSDAEKLQFKSDIIRQCGLSYCIDLLSAGEYTKLECKINFCLSTEEMKLQFKVDVLKMACHDFLKDCAWEEMDKSIVWIFDTEEKIKDFKNDLFYSDDFVFQIHLKLLFNKKPRWQNVELLYKWFCLSPEEITTLKKKTAFSPKVIDIVYNALCGTMGRFDKEIYGELDAIVKSLCWCLTDEQMVINFKEEMEKHFCDLKGIRANKNAKKGKEQLGYLVTKLLQNYCKKVVHGKTSREVQFMKDKKEKKKSLMMEDDKFNSTRKRLKKTL